VIGVADGENISSSMKSMKRASRSGESSNITTILASTSKNLFALGSGIGSIGSGQFIPQLSV
jgi:hypothetical protein